MRKMLVCSLGMLLAASLVPAAAGRQVSAGVSIRAGGFYLSVGSYYRVPEAEVLMVRDRYHLADEELPVVFFLAARAQVAPSVIVGFRLRKLSWLDIAFRYNLTPDIFYVPVTSERIGPPYGRAYGYFKKYRARREWRRIVLSDREVVDLVNLRFMSEFHKTTPEKIMQMRAGGRAFVAINDEMARSKAGPGKGPKGEPGKPKGGRQK